MNIHTTKIASACAEARRAGGSISTVAAAAGSAATTPAGARRYLLKRLATPVWKQAPRAAAWNRGAAARAVWMRARRWAQGDAICRAAGLWPLDHAVAACVAADEAVLTVIGAARYPYNFPCGRWAGGSVHVTVQRPLPPGREREIDAVAATHRVWSKNRKWSGNDVHVTFTVSRRAVMELGSANLVIGGLMTLDAERIAPRVYRAAWAEQSRGLGLKVVHGWIIRGYHSTKKSLAAASKEAAEARLAKAETLRYEHLLARRKRAEWRRDFSAVWVTAEDSIAAGNCSNGTRVAEAAVRRALRGNPYAVRGDVLLGILTPAQRVYATAAIVAARRRLEQWRASHA